MIILLIIVLGLVFCIGMYLFMIMPRIFGRPDTSFFRKWLYAHRGLYDNSSNAPENSLAAFDRAVKGGFGIELDVQLSKDGIPMVFHDFTLKRICGVEGKVCDYTCRELQEFRLCDSEQRIPRLEEALELVDGRVPLIVELKLPTMDVSVCPAADRLLSEYKGMYCIESFHPLAVRWYRKNRREIVRGQLSDAFLKEGEFSGLVCFFLQNLLFNWMSRPDFVAYNHKYPKMFSRRLCRGFYRNTAVAWTIKTPYELETARRYFDICIFDSFVPEK